MTAELFTLLAQFGPMGLFVAYLVWDKGEARKVERERIESDKALTTALTAMLVTIQHLDKAAK